MIAKADKPLAPKQGSHEGMIVVAAIGAMFVVFFTATVTGLAIKGDFPVVLLIVIYFVVGLGAYAIRGMIKTDMRLSR